jgi:hypothetical protein
MNGPDLRVRIKIGTALPDKPLCMEYRLPDIEAATRMATLAQKALSSE